MARGRTDERWFAMQGFLGVVAFLVVATVAAGGPMAVVDYEGRRVEVPGPVRRVVCLGPGALRQIVYLQAQDLVVAVEDMELRNPEGRPYWMAHEELHDLPVCGPGGPAAINRLPDGEAVLAAAPDVVFVAAQRRLGIPVVILGYGGFATFSDRVYDSLRLAGALLGRAERARTVVDFIEGQRRELGRRAVGTTKRPRVYVGGLGFRGAQGLSSSEASYAPFDWLGLDNVVRPLPTTGGTHVTVDVETLLSLDPDWIFVDGGGRDIVRREFADRPAVLGALTAVEEGRVLGLHPFNWYTTNLGTVIVDAWAVGAAVLPHAFADVDVAAVAGSVYRTLVGRDVHYAMVRRYGPVGGAVAGVP